MQQVTEKGIEDILSENGKLTDDKLSMVKTEAIKTGKQVEEVILDRKFATLEDITQARAQLLGIEFINPSGKPVPSDVLSKIPEPVVRRYELIPFQYKKGPKSLSRAMARPLCL